MHSRADRIWGWVVGGAFFLLILEFVTILYLHIGDQKHIRLEKSEVRSFVLTRVYRPKHFRVNLRDQKTGRMKIEVYVSKHCNSWRRTAVVGRVYNITLDTYLDDRDSTRRVVYRNLERIFCR
jgi:hypothetical protein